MVELRRPTVTFRSYVRINSLGLEFGGLVRRSVAVGIQLTIWVVELYLWHLSIQYVV
jgi:hypothetical protein